MDRPAPSDIRPLTRDLRWTFVVVAILLLAAGATTMLRSESTGEHFAWTIKPPLTAAFMGAGYWASVVLLLVAARAHPWAHARIAVPSSIVFSFLTLGATLLHFDPFHTDRPITWAWLGIYIVVPTLLTFSTLRQLRVPGGDPPRVAPFPDWARWSAVGLATVAIGTGVALFVAPTRADVLWSWTLTPLTGRIVAAWLVGIGLLAAHAALEADWLRALPALAAATAFAALQLLNLARYSGTIDWGPTGWAYVAGLVALLAFSLEGLRQCQKSGGTRKRVPSSGSAIGQSDRPVDSDGTRASSHS